MSRHIDDATALALITGQLEPDAASAVEAHVAGCPDCAARIDEVRAVCAHLPATPAEASLGFDTRLRARLDAIDAAPARGWARVFGWGVAPAVAMAVAFLALAPRPESGSAIELEAEPALLADLALFEDLEAVELVDVVDDLDAIAGLPEEEG